MSERPELAVYVARVATGWSHVEKFYGYLVVQLLGAHAHAGMRMYKALSGSASQTAVLRAVARDRLPQPMMDELEDLLRRTRKAAGKRNDVVHGLWEISDELPDALVWCDSADSLLSHSEFWAGWLSRDLGDRISWATREFKGKGPRYLVYEKQDFQQILDEIQSVLARLMTFLHACMDLNKPASDGESLAGNGGEILK
jgi:hypothetical protein